MNFVVGVARLGLIAAVTRRRRGVPLARTMRRTTLSCAACFLAVVGWTGCGTAYSGPRLSSQASCADGPAAPISLARARRALTEARYEPHLDRSLCNATGPPSVQSLGELTFAHTRCSVYKAEPARQQELPHTRFEGRNYSGKAYVVAFENLDCWVYAGGSDRSTIVSALRRIFLSFGATAKTAAQYGR